jgi:hypothetical protein
MAYPPFATSKRPRRRRTLALLLIVAVTVGIVALAVRFRTEERDSIDYLANAKGLADSQASMAGSLADLLASLDDLERPDILKRIDGLAREFRGLVAVLEGATVTAEVGEANGFFVVAVSSWGAALDALGDGIVEVLDGEDDGRLGELVLAEAFVDLRVGDRAYERFRAVVEGLDAELRAPDFPDVAYVGGQQPLLYDAFVIADLLRATLRFVENIDVSVRATTDPEPLGTDKGVPVVPDSETFSVQAVVTNEGNVSAQLITVSFLLTEVGGDGLEERSEIIGLLEPGLATTVLFDGIVLVPGAGYRLMISVDIEDDDVPDNNIWELDFLRNQP